MKIASKVVEDDDWEERKPAPPSPPGMFIWCPKDVHRTKVGWAQNSVGANRHINCCLIVGCTCDELEGRIEELYGQINPK